MKLQKDLETAGSDPKQRKLNFGTAWDWYRTTSAIELHVEPISGSAVDLISLPAACRTG